MTAQGEPPIGVGGDSAATQTPLHAGRLQTPLSRTDFYGDGGFVVADVLCASHCLEPESGEVLELDGWDVVQCGVQPSGVEPADVVDDGELELGAGAPDTIGDQLGFEAVDEALGHRRGSQFERAEMATEQKPGAVRTTVIVQPTGRRPARDSKKRIPRAGMSPAASGGRTVEPVTEEDS